MQTPRQRRLAAILELLEGGPIESQSALGELLDGRGLGVDQGTLSRDLRSLEVRKGPQGYELAGAAPTTGTLEQAVRQWLREVRSALNQVVLLTPPGGASPLAVAIDENRPETVLGTLAGDDTVLVICQDQRSAQRFRQLLEGLMTGERS
ncbi:MAG: ArgR family transcriptional regulator [Acidobacteriota bacterium]